MNSREPSVLDHPASNVQEQARYFEQRYRRESEPWSFSTRAVEGLRHAWIANVAASLGPSRILDVGCSLGQLSTRLAPFAPELLAIDVSPTAVAGARRRAFPRRPDFIAGGALSLPLASETVDLTIASDGIYSWNLELEERVVALSELRRVTRIGGHVLLTEHTRRERFAGFVREIEHSGLRVQRVSYLYDRPWYQVESLFKALQPYRCVQAARRSALIARVLCTVGRLIGPAASRHICVLALRDR